MIGGQAWIAMDPPNAEGNPQEGLLNVTDFSVKGKPRSTASPRGRPTCRTTACSSAACGRASPGRPAG